MRTDADPIAHVEEMFALGPASAPAADEAIRPLGVALALRAPAGASRDGVELAYCEELQVSVVDGVPAVESAAAAAVLAKKANTVEDSQTWTDEVAQ